jgi:hypothetical protein
MNHTWGRTGFDIAETATNVQRVMAYHASPGVDTTTADTIDADYVAEGISEIESFLADAALAVA